MAMSAFFADDLRIPPPPRRPRELRPFTLRLRPRSAVEELPLAALAGFAAAALCAACFGL